MCFSADGNVLCFTGPIDNFGFDKCVTVCVEVPPMSVVVCELAVAGEEFGPSTFSFIGEEKLGTDDKARRRPTSEGGISAIGPLSELV